MSKVNSSVLPLTAVICVFGVLDEVRGKLEEHLERQRGAASGEAR